MDYVTIGFMREDGDLEVLATFLNEPKHLNKEIFERTIRDVVTLYKNNGIHDVSVFERQDTPDCVSINDD